ncbi:hypothetical protein J007_00030 [Cryptococcus neoformans]|nr:hypothetical protein J007_00030 [Cryptococcus neoformans var. grubii]OXC66958.1 hypothetical protein C358_00030 [Cryptococcus neoformans var. grubii MW-RSA852]
MRMTMMKKKTSPLTSTASRSTTPSSMGPIETIENSCYDPNQPEIQKPAILLNINIGTLAHCLKFTPTPTITRSFDEIFNSEPLITALQTSLRVSFHIPRTTREQLST